MTTVGAVAGAPIGNLLLQVDRAALVLACAAGVVAMGALGLRRAGRRI